MSLLFDITIVNAFSGKCLPFISLIKKYCSGTASFLMMP